MFQIHSCRVSKPSDISGGIFSKRVTDDDDRRKTFFLTSCGEFSSLIPRFTMEYRTSNRGSAFPELCKNFSCPSTSKFLDFFFALIELRTFVPDHVVAIRLFFFLAKEQLFEQLVCHPMFPVRGKLIVDSLWKSSSPVSALEIIVEFTNCRSRRGKPSCTQR